MENGNFGRPHRVAPTSSQIVYTTNILQPIILHFAFWIFHLTAPPLRRHKSPLCLQAPLWAFHLEGKVGFAIGKTRMRWKYRDDVGIVPYIVTNRPYNKYFAAHHFTFWIFNFTFNSSTLRTFSAVFLYLFQQLLFSVFASLVPFGWIYKSILFALS